MKYYSTNKQAPVASLEEAVVKGLADDKGLYRLLGRGGDSQHEEPVLPRDRLHGSSDVLRGRHRAGGIGRYRKRYALLRDPGGTRKG